MYCVLFTYYRGFFSQPTHSKLRTFFTRTWKLKKTVDVIYVVSIAKIHTTIISGIIYKNNNKNLVKKAGYNFTHISFIFQMTWKISLEFIWSGCGARANKLRASLCSSLTCCRRYEKTPSDFRAKAAPNYVCRITAVQSLSLAL